MILHRDNGKQVYVQVGGSVIGARIDALTLNATDVQKLLELPPDQLRNYLGAHLLTRFGPSSVQSDIDSQRRQVEAHNRRLKGSEAIDDFHPGKFTADPPRNMFIGPGLVPYEAEGMTQLDPEASQVLADNLWDLYTRSDE